VAVPNLGPSAITQDTRNAVILDRAKGDPTRLVALKYQISESSVRDIYNDFLKSTASVRTIADSEPEEFRASIRRKAIFAIEHGLDCDRDPYRQASVGLKVMEGIGEFKSGGNASIVINNMVASVPAEWKDRYIGLESKEPKQLKEG
jgi:hypothetical protein